MNKDQRKETDPEEKKKKKSISSRPEYNRPGGEWHKLSRTRAAYIIARSLKSYAEVYSTWQTLEILYQCINVVLTKAEKLI